MFFLFQGKDQMRGIIKCSRLHTSTLKHLGDYIIYIDMCIKKAKKIEGKSSLKESSAE